MVLLPQSLGQHKMSGATNKQVSLRQRVAFQPMQICDDDVWCEQRTMGPTHSLTSCSNVLTTFTIFRYSTGYVGQSLPEPFLLKAVPICEQKAPQRSFSAMSLSEVLLFENFTATPFASTASGKPLKKAEIFSNFLSCPTRCAVLFYAGITASTSAEHV